MGAQLDVVQSYYCKMNVHGHEQTRNRSVCTSLALYTDVVQAYYCKMSVHGHEQTRKPIRLHLNCTEVVYSPFPLGCECVRAAGWWGQRVQRAGTPLWQPLARV
jgi:hypothetical protein